MMDKRILLTVPFRITDRFRLILIGMMLLGWGCLPGATAYGDSGSGDTAGAAEAQVRAFRLDPQPLVSISFDDGSQTIYDTAFPILSANGIPASFYFVTNNLNELWKTQLRDLEDQGWEIGSHSVTHPDLPTLSEPDLIQELRQSKSDLEAAGLTVTGFAYPHGVGSDDANVTRRIKQYYSYARSVKPGNNAPILRQYALASQTVTGATSPAMIKSWIDSAILNRQWLVILLHNVDDTGTDYATSPAVLAEAANYIKGKVDGGELSAVTVHEGLTRYSETYWQPVEAPQSLDGTDAVITNGRVLWRIGSKISDYLYDGHEWVENGAFRYYEMNGLYRTISVPSHIALASISPERAVLEITLSSVDGAASVLSTITLKPGSPLAEIRTGDLQGATLRLSLAKDLARRFTIDEAQMVTDGTLETGKRAYQNSAQSLFALGGTTDLIRIMTHMPRKPHSEYSDYARGEFRCGPLSVAGDLPFTWWVGGIAFDHSGLFAETETGVLGGGSTFYAGDDASPRKGNTGVTLNSGDTVITQLTPPVQGNYLLSIRREAASAGAQYSYQIDDGEPVIETVTGAGFGYGSTFLPDLSAQTHTVRVAALSGEVTVDYVLLVPGSRSANTPAATEFPIDVLRQAYGHQMLPIVRR